MNSLQTLAKRRQAMGRLYTRIEDKSPTRDISFDEEGVIALCGSQGTNHVYYAERQAVDADEGTMTFRVIRFEPNYKKGMQPNARTGVPEYGERMNTCKYLIGDVTVPALGTRMKLGQALREIQEEFRYVERGQPLDAGSVNADREVMGLYRRWFLQPDG